MFFREKKSPTAKNPTLQLVENIRKGDKTRQRVIVSLGTHFNLPKELRRETARAIEDKLQGQAALWFSPEVNAHAERVIRKLQYQGKWQSLSAQKNKTTEPGLDQVEQVLIEQIHHGQTRVAGSLLAGLRAWEILDLDKILADASMSKGQIINAKIAILHRLINPGSEFSIPYWIQTTAVEDLICPDAGEFKEDRFYRISDTLLDSKDQIEKDLYSKETSCFKLPGTLWLYDLTNTYFEGTQNANPKAQYNKNQKEKRTDCPQIVIALIIDEEGFIRRHFTFEGKLTDVKSLEKILKELESEFKYVDKPTIIMDRGIASEDNIKLLKEKGLYYIIASRREEEQANSKEFNSQGFRSLKTNSGQKIEVKVKESDQEIQLLCKSPKRKEKEKAMRTLREERLESDLEKLAQSIQNGNIVAPEKINQSIGRIRERHPSVAKYYHIVYRHTSSQWNTGKDIPKRLQNSLTTLKKNILTGAVSYLRAQKKIQEFIQKYPQQDLASKLKITKPELSWSIESKKQQTLSNTDGGYIIKTNRKDLSDQVIWKTYVNLTKVEKAFRNFKSDLGLRPNFHLIENRVDGHVFITVLAYHLLHTIEYILQQKEMHLSWWRLNQILSTHCYCTISLPTLKGQVLHVRKAGVPEATHINIYDKLEVKYNDLPVKKILA